MKRRRRVLVTHVDQPLGRILAARLIEDPTVARLDTVGAIGAEAPFEHRFAHDPDRLRHHEADLSKPRDVDDLFAATDPDAVFLLPRTSDRDPRGRPWLANVPPRTVETRLVLQQCLERGPVDQLIALGSMVAYELAAGNANHLDERSPLALAPEWPASARAWVDCDMMVHAEIHHPTLSVALLRLPTVVTCEGELVLSPTDVGGLALRALGFDPMCPLVVDRDVVQAAVQALHLRARGVFNIAGDQSVPLSAIDRAHHTWRIPVPSPLIRALGRSLERLGADAIGRRIDTPHVRHGVHLDTERAQRDLGFKPTYRVTLRPDGERGHTLEPRPL